MASSSLQDLLAEEGFKGRKITSHRTSFGSEGASMPLYLYKEKKPLTASSSVRVRTERTRSDVSRYDTGSEFLKTKGVRSQLPRETLIETHKIVKETNTNDFGESEEEEGIDPNVVQEEVKRLNSRLSVDIQGSEITNGRRRSDAQVGHKYKDIYSNNVFESDVGKDSNSASGKDQKYKNSSNKLLRGRTSLSSNNTSKSLMKTVSSASNYTKVIHSRKHIDTEKSAPEPALDDVAVKAMVSILTIHIKSFLKNKEFRESLRENCLSCLVSTTSGEDNKVIPNLEQAIDTIERFAEDSGDAKDLKKASFQLSVITSLISKELKDGFISGIPTALLSACAHLYHSVVYMLLKKDNVSAKHILRVFCDSPLLARTRLLPELWDYLFLPNLSHLKTWYDQEASSIPDTSSRPRKLKLLEKVYNEIMDSGTYQFAAYYKDWLTEGVEAPAVPSIHIPSTSVQELSKGNSHGQYSEQASPIGSVSSQPMVSKMLYETVFGQESKSEGVGEVRCGEEEENFDNCASSFGGTVEEEKKTVTCSPEQGRYREQTFHTIGTTEDASRHGDDYIPTSEEGWPLPKVVPQSEELKDEAQFTPLWSSIPGNICTPHLVPLKKANDLILKKLADSVFQQPQARDSTDYSTSNHMSHSSVSMDKSLKLRNGSYRVEEQYVNDTYLEDGSFFSSIPQDFICPLTGELFEDPVTLETGETFEQMAIKEWLEKGNTTCPMTGKILECLGVPVTNLVLKRIVGSWKAEHSRKLLAFASKIGKTSSGNGYKSKGQGAILILEQLLSGFKTEERLMNAKHLISLGGLQFLIQRFELSNLEQKSRIIVLFSRCIEADGGCRNYIAKNINKACLLELLHNKQAKSRENAVKLLTELICLYRRTEITSFLRSMQKEGLMNTMHVLLVYLQSSSLDQRPSIAILLLHFDLLVEPRKYSIYREEAVDSIIEALECSLADEKVREQCCRSLLILGGHMSYSGELLIENWLLKHAGFYDGRDTTYLDNIEDNSYIDKTTMMADEENAREDWWKSLATSLLGNGKKSFLEIISKCLGSGDLRLVKVCLVTVAWLSQALTVLPDAEFQLSAFSALIPRLKETLENGNQVELRVLASLALLNFSRISECRVLLMTIGKEILIPLQSLSVITWTAKQLHGLISGDRRL